MAPDHKDPRIRAAAALHGALALFARNGRWGTCGACPQDTLGNKLPELCADTERHDHQLTIEAIAFQFNHQLKEQRLADERAYQRHDFRRDGCPDGERACVRCGAVEFTRSAKDPCRS